MLPLPPPPSGATAWKLSPTMPRTPSARIGDTGAPIGVKGCAATATTGAREKRTRSPTWTESFCVMISVEPECDEMKFTFSSAMIVVSRTTTTRLVVASLSLDPAEM